MKHLTLHLTEAAFNLIKAKHARPGVALTLDDGAMHLLPTDGFVDLGLSVKWASFNIGANPGSTKESWYGNFYAWGETETKTNYWWNTYAFGSSSPFKKYDTDGKTILESEDDIATRTYGSDYHIPTKEELEELIDTTKVTNVWIRNYNPNNLTHNPEDDGGISGLNGRLFTSVSNGNTLFIPAAGYFSLSSHIEAETNGVIWSSSLSTGSHGSQNAWSFFFYSDGININDSYIRCAGFSVRAVKSI